MQPKPLQSLMPPMSTDGSLSAGDEAVCDSLIAGGSKTFHAASLLLPRQYRRAARALYAFCRTADDLVDNGEAGIPGDLEACEALRRRLDRIYSGAPLSRQADRALASVVRAHGLPRELPEAMVEGFEWDCQGRRYRTLDDLLDYAARVAGVVGVMMSAIMGRREPSVLVRAGELGLAMQLTNIARDVGEDARRGRIYLPLDWLAQAGIDPEAFLARPRMSPQLAEVVRQLLFAADRYYESGLKGVPALPASCRPAIRAAGLAYRAIGRNIARNNYDSVTMRAHTGTPKKIALLAWSGATAFFPLPIPARAPHPSIRAMVERTAIEASPPSGLDAQMGRFIDLLSTFEERHRLRSAQRIGYAR